MKLLLDEQISGKVAEQLSARGIDALAVSSDSEPMRADLIPGPGRREKISTRCLPRDRVLLARRVASLRGQHFDLAPGAGRLLDSSVGSQQRGLEHLCEGDVGGVIGGQALAELPDPQQERAVGG